MTTEAITITGEGLALDQLVWRKFRRAVPGLVEQVLALNPGLAQLGPILPVGTVVVVPVLASAQETPAREIIQLWD